MNSEITSLNFVDIPSEFQNAAILKFDILANGLRLTSDAYEQIFGASSSMHVKRPIRARSGSSGGLDIQLKGDIFVNAPLVETNDYTNVATLDWVNNHFVIDKIGLNSEKVFLLPEPKFYSMKTSLRNIPMHRIAQMCSPDRLCYGMTGSKCAFWNAQDRCRFCSIGFNTSFDELDKTEEELYEVLSYAMNEDKYPAHHILLGGGIPNGPDMGAMLAARLCKEIKSRFNISVYVMIAAPLEDKYIYELYDAGVDELGINLEFWSEEAWRQYIPGKMRHIGKQRYLQALECAVKLFGPINTRSLLVVGLESFCDTLVGVETLAGMGVMPILSPFRPLKGTNLAHNTGFSTEQYIKLYEESKRICKANKLPLGPTCTCCQNNTLTLPFFPPIDATSKT